MACVIIVCRYSRRQGLWRGKAHADPFVVSGGCVRFLWALEQTRSVVMRSARISRWIIGPGRRCLLARRPWSLTAFVLQ